VEIKRKVMTENQRQPKTPLWEKLKSKARQMRHAPTKAEQLLWQKLRSRQAVIINAVRTPIGALGRVLAPVRPDDLAAFVLVAFYK
jgi:hypothetical protein